MPRTGAERRPARARGPDEGRRVTASSAVVDTGESIRSHPRLVAGVCLAVILIVGCVVLLPDLGAFGFWDPWEPKYAESGREMLDRGSYFVPYYRDEVRLTKPILVYWGILAGAAVFGLDEFGARIVGVLMALASMFAVYYAISILRGRRAAVLSATVLGTIPLFYLLARTATPDVYLLTSLGSSLIFFCLAAFGPDRRRDLHFVLSYVCFSLAVLAKGPVVAGSLYFVPLAIYGLARMDFGLLWQPGLRPRTVPLIVFGVPAAALTAVFSASAYLLGTSPEWWGYSDASREFTFELRRQLWAVVQGARLADVALVLFALGGAGLAYWIIRHGSGKRRYMAAFPIVLVLAAVRSLLADDLSGRAINASALGAIICPIGVLALVRHVLGHPALEDDVRLFMRSLARQAVFFLIVLVVVAGPWHAVIFFEQRQGYFTDFILKHNVSRVGDAINSSGSADFYLRSMVYGFFPWSCFIPIALTSLVRWWGRDPFRRHAVEIYLIISSAVIFAAFSTSATKFSYYLAPILIPMAVLIGIALDRMLDHEARFTSRLGWIVALLLYLAPVADLLDPENMKYLVGVSTVKRHIPESVVAGDYFVGLLVVWGMILGLLVVARSRILLGALIACAVLLGHFMTSSFIPELTPHKTMKHLVEAWQRHRVSDEPIAFYGSMKHGTIYYTENTISFIEEDEDFLEFMRPDRPAFCILERDWLEELEESYHELHSDRWLDVVEAGHFDFVLVTNRPVDARP